MRKPPFAAILLMLLLAAALCDAAAVTLYVRRVVVAQPGGLTVGDLVQTSGEVSQELREALARSVAILSDRLLIIPSGLYSGLFEQSLGGGLILVGKRTLVVPQGSLADAALPLVDRLADYLENQGGIGRGRVELEVGQVSGLPAGMPPSGLVFTTIRAERKAGLFSGPAEFSFSYAGQNPGQLGGFIALKITQVETPAPSAPGSVSTGDGMVLGSLAGAMAGDAGVRENDPVSVFFRKGAITIEMPGRALQSAHLGEQAKVFIPESRLSFSGIVVGNKAVSVEIR
jgi:hypothetical protein